MKKVMFVLMVLCVVGFVSAEHYKFGPYKNYQGTENFSGTLLVPTTTDAMSINDPWGGSHHIAARGGQEINFTIENYPIIANSYLEFDSQEGSPFNPETDDLILTEVWARDLTPSGLYEPPMSEGFAPGDVTMTAPGFYTGRSGTDYPTGTPEAVLLSDLPARLPGYDIGSIGGAPDSVVYVTQATVPAADVIVEMPSPYLLLDSKDEWQIKLDTEWPLARIEALTLEEGQEYLSQLKLFKLPDSEFPYSPIDPDLPEFIPPDLYVYKGDDDPANSDPDDAGLVMKWGDDQEPDGERASAWKFDYGDPDLTNCIITVTATPPSGCNINRISIGMQDVNGNVCSWWWVVPSAIFPYDTPTTVTIDTSQINASAGIGLAAASPAASGCAINPAFDLTKVLSIIADENANPMGGVTAPPPTTPPTTISAIWNYWHNLSVTPKSPSGGANSKWYVKWSQGPDVMNEPNDPALINGWDEHSVYDAQTQGQYPIMADDWECSDERPVTDIHWWGSFYRVDSQTGQRIAWTQPTLPPKSTLPSAFHIGIWTNQVDQNPNPGSHGDGDWSHPLTLVWENFCDTSVWNFAGYDVDPRVGDLDQGENEACFQWAQFLSQDDWFHQHPMEDGTPNVYWLSISAIYPAGTNFNDPDFYVWGWKTRPWNFEDDAVQIQQTSSGIWPPVMGTTLGMTDCDPIHIDNISWDLAFELTTNEPGYVDDPIPGDITGPGGDMVPDGSVDLNDFSIMALHWLEIAP